MDPLEMAKNAAAADKSPLPEGMIQMDPLEMAENAAAAVGRYADYQDQDPVGAYIARAGQQGHDAARLAGCMALVSIARDLRRIADIEFQLPRKEDS